MTARSLSPWRLAKWVALLSITTLFLFPFYWTFVTAIKANPELLTWPPTWWPAAPQWDNFAAAWAAQPFGTYLKNSVIVTVLSTTGQLLSSSLVAFGFARFDFPGRNALFMVLLAAMIRRSIGSPIFLATKPAKISPKLPVGTENETRRWGAPKALAATK